MAWLKLVKKGRRAKTRKMVNPATLIERYKMGKPIKLQNCWECPLFYRYDTCPFRFWVGRRLYCIKEACRIDSRLLNGLTEWMKNL